MPPKGNVIRQEPDGPPEHVWSSQLGQLQIPAVEDGQKLMTRPEGGRVTGDGSVDTTPPPELPELPKN